MYGIGYIFFPHLLLLSRLWFHCQHVFHHQDRQADTAVASPGDRDHSADCSDLIVDKVMHIELRERVEKENGERRSRDVDEGGDVGINYQERRINALSYVKDVKQMFQDQRD